MNVVCLGLVTSRAHPVTAGWTPAPSQGLSRDQRVELVIICCTFDRLVTLSAGRPPAGPVSDLSCRRHETPFLSGFLT